MTKLKKTIARYDGLKLDGMSQPGGHSNHYTSKYSDQGENVNFYGELSRDVESTEISEID